jgi:hypothetical protein
LFRYLFSLLISLLSSNILLLYFSQKKNIEDLKQNLQIVILYLLFYRWATSEFVSLSLTQFNRWFCFFCCSYAFWKDCFLLFPDPSQVNPINLFFCFSLYSHLFHRIDRWKIPFHFFFHSNYHLEHNCSIQIQYFSLWCYLWNISYLSKSTETS